MGGLVPLLCCLAFAAIGGAFGQWVTKPPQNRLRRRRSA